VRRVFVLLWLISAICHAESRVVAVNIDGVIHPITVEIISHAVDQAAREQADLVLIRLNTPGGMMEATRQVTQKMISSPIPVVTFVAPNGGRAASAGFFLLQAGDIAAMAVGTNTGAASPILLGREMDPVLRKKVENDAAASLRSLTSRRGRNAELAEKAVLEARSFTEREALKNNLVDLVVQDEKELLAKLDSREVAHFDGRRQTLRLAGARVVDYKPSIRERIVSSISDPNVAFVLLILGILGIYIEFSSPGLILPGVAGGILVLLGLSALSVLPINWVGLALLLLSFAFFVLEAKFVSHGILGAGGVAAMVLGALLLIEGPPEIRIRLGTALAVALPFAGITVFLVSLVVRARAQKVVTGPSAMQDKIGVALTPLSPRGKVVVQGEYWDAVSATPVAPGASVRVIELQGLLLKVEPIS
jgi:membrane-bound serine protease (ClpP class)